MKLTHTLLTLSLVATTAIFTGCGQTADKSASTSSQVDSDLLIESEPADAKDVGEVFEASKDGDEVTIVGRIGGSQAPFVDGLAAFTIVDTGIPHCADDEGCPTPWDYCCTTNQLPGNQATVKIVDESGQPIPKTAKGLLGINELSVVVVKGNAVRDDAGNLSVTANQVYVKDKK
ncbi:hypothetical protein [Thalassoglobus polymorphus]|uniref:Uncharacterized protein n=1 Tax=Thalassoglobus polymorphus TaxID=2527994 RepID=A0A517QJQ8_9PLAN|nr:hypothetical protein [Thalassoglobus polymorphus]QDT31835.1 hypothetical protein Mal48_10710 [Thalassoglobus polymorphus]